jgi:hypothetical protein
MGTEELETLVKIGQLKHEPPTRAEFNGMVGGAVKRLADTQNKDLAAESRFDLAYGASHGLALAALRLKSYRSENRYIVFQAKVWTLLPFEFSRRAITSLIWPNTRGARR